jgi:hypothetical protein
MLTEGDEMVGKVFCNGENLNGEQIFHNISDSVKNMIEAVHSDSEVSATQVEWTGNENMNCKLCDLLRGSHKTKTFIKRLTFGSLFLHQNQIYEGRCLYISNAQSLFWYKNPAYAQYI